MSMSSAPMTATEAEDLAKAEGLVLVPSNSGPHHPRYLGVSMHTDPATNEVFFCASVIQQGTTLYLQDALGNVKFTSDAEAALTFARYTAGRNTVDERSQPPNRAPCPRRAPVAPPPPSPPLVLRVTCHPPPRQVEAGAQAQAQAQAGAHEQALLAQEQAAQAAQAAQVQQPEGGDWCDRRCGGGTGAGAGGAGSRADARAGPGPGPGACAAAAAAGTGTGTGAGTGAGTRAAAAAAGSRAAAGAAAAAAAAAGAGACAAAAAAGTPAAAAAAAGAGAAAGATAAAAAAAGEPVERFLRQLRWQPGLGAPAARLRTAAAGGAAPLLGGLRAGVAPRAIGQAARAQGGDGHAHPQGAAALGLPVLRTRHTARQHGQSAPPPLGSPPRQCPSWAHAPLAVVPQLGCRASSGRA
eukprot:scaffold28893_cov40-Phaeocystis_antarctica.AAC.3